MGWEVIALGSVEIVSFGDALKKGTIVENMEKLSVKLSYVDFVTKSQLWVGDVKNAYIEMELSGNKAIDYTPLEQELVSFQLVSGMKVKCVLGEYSETGDGFYFGEEFEDE
jgi:hypothetical protein